MQKLSRFFKLALVLFSLWAGCIFLRAIYIIWSGQLSAIIGQNVLALCRSEVLFMIGIAFVLFYWPIYVMSHEWKWIRRDLP